MTGPPAAPGTLRWRLWGRYHRDARLILVVSLLAGTALSMWWINFNLYLAALGFSTTTIGLLATLANLAGGLVAFPASAASDRVGRRAVLVAALVAGIVAPGLLVAAGNLVLLVGAAAMLWTAGVSAFLVVVPPLLAERSTLDHRDELFALQSAILSGANVLAAMLGGGVALVVAVALGVDQQDLAVYRVILMLTAVLLAAGLLSVRLFADDGRAKAAAATLPQVADRTASPTPRPRSGSRLGINIRNRSLFARLVLPGFLISVGAGAVIPFLNLFVKTKFGLDLAEVNGVFALTSLGTVLAILFQPHLARRFGQIASVIMVQAASIPFLIVLGFSPILWTVVVAMTVRGSLMNAGNPIFSAFAMAAVDAAERATLSAATRVSWQLGWVIGGLVYASLQAALGFDAGFNACFLAAVALYAIATALYWVWFGASSSRNPPLASAAGDG